MSLNRAELGVIARHAWIINYKIIFQPTPDIDDDLGQWVEFASLNDEESIGRDVINFFTHTAIIMQFCLCLDIVQSFCIVPQESVEKLHTGDIINPSYRWNKRKFQIAGSIPVGTAAHN